MTNTHELFSSFKPVLIDNIFTEEEIESIYKTRFEIAPNEINAEGQNYVFSDPGCGYITSIYPFEYKIRTKIVETIQKYVPIPVKEDGNHMPRYTLESGDKPRLYPHYDVGMKSASFTLSAQLKNTKQWSLFVGGHEFDLKYNQGVIFSGSHQIHWRPKIEFDKSDYYDIIVSQVYEDTENPLLLDETHRENMKAKADFYGNKFFT